MKNQEMEKTVLNELADDMLDNVSGGVVRIILDEQQTDNDDDSNNKDSFVMGGSMLR